MDRLHSTALVSSHVARVVRSSHPRVQTCPRGSTPRSASRRCGPGRRCRCSVWPAATRPPPSPGASTPSPSPSPTPAPRGTPSWTGQCAYCKHYLKYLRENAQMLKNLDRGTMYVRVSRANIMITNSAEGCEVSRHCSDCRRLQHRSDLCSALSGDTLHAWLHSRYFNVNVAGNFSSSLLNAALSKSEWTVFLAGQNSTE